MNRPQVAYFLSGVLDHFPSGVPNKEAFHEQLLKEVSAFTYKARRVFLYDAALDRLDQIGG
jgi:hypothetical protein